ncbi:MAG: GNAT family N-acetyltransferase [Clostridia bacterium]|nr:GNAT family N-acetyltransferase [Clostridia bacterium]
MKKEYPFIRRAQEHDLDRIAEIEVFNYRLNFYPIFRNDAYYFDELRVQPLAKAYLPLLDQLWVYDDGVVKGFMMAQGDEIQKLFVEPVLRGQGIGAKLLEFAINELGACQLWALEKNARAIAFYQRHGFKVTEDKRLEEDTTEYLVRLKR